MKKLERWKEVEKRKRRKRNIVIKRMKVDKGDLREEVRKLWKEMVM